MNTKTININKRAKIAHLLGQDVQVRDIVRMNWYQLNNDRHILRNLMLSMRKRYEAVIMCNGNNTKY